jgi:hypothetical protein
MNSTLHDHLRNVSLTNAELSDLATSKHQFPVHVLAGVSHTFRKLRSCCGYITSKIAYSSVPQPFFHGRTPTIIFDIAMNPYLQKTFQARKVDTREPFCYHW